MKVSSWSVSNRVGPKCGRCFAPGTPQTLDLFTLQWMKSYLSTRASQTVDAHECVTAVLRNPAGPTSLHNQYLYFTLMHVLVFNIRGWIPN